VTPLRTVCLVLLLLSGLFLAVLFMEGASEDGLEPPGWTYAVRNRLQSLSPTLQLQAAPLELAPGSSWNRTVSPGRTPLRILRFCLDSNSRLEAVYAASIRGSGDEQLMEMLSEDDGCEDGECEMELPRPENQGPGDNRRCGSFIVVSGGGQFSLKCAGTNPCRVRFE
jgi:hypothetical protein